MSVSNINIELLDNDIADDAVEQGTMCAGGCKSRCKTDRPCLIFAPSGKVYSKFEEELLRQAMGEVKEVILDG